MKILKHFLFRCCALPILLMPAAAFASSDDALTDVLGNLIDLLQSTPARLLAVVAVISVGYGCIHLGKIPKDRAIAIVIGIGLIFGAAYIMGQLGYSA